MYGSPSDHICTDSAFTSYTENCVHPALFSGLATHLDKKIKNKNEYLLNNLSETVASYTETFTRHVLVNLGFHHLSSSNSNHNYQGCYDYCLYDFERALNKSCFTCELIDRYK